VKSSETGIPKKSGRKSTSSTARQPKTLCLGISHVSKPDETSLRRNGFEFKKVTHSMRKHESLAMTRWILLKGVSRQLP